ncbi:hypothetical protein DCCM_4521 [Desulfocucumis palustris]|uniref:Uncharacterized protein n=1 Tax=Desulfocucumis palustris TaxID=1898651 RepID=A0A2L2XGP0_9FIRM|nr:hypothetical protein DCCM_4521 [Desulfocucumis palustris]
MFFPRPEAIEELRARPVFKGPVHIFQQTAGGVKYDQADFCK